jgi:acetyl esterase/lipase
MTAAITIMAKQRGGPQIAAQVLSYPVTNADFDTDSYHQFATGYWLRRDGTDGSIRSGLAPPEPPSQRSWPIAAG